MNIADSDSLAAIAYWLRVIGLAWLATAAAVIVDKAYSMYRLKEAGRYFEAGSFAFGFIIKGLNSLLERKEKARGAHAGTGTDGMRQEHGGSGTAPQAKG